MQLIVKQINFRAVDGSGASLFLLTDTESVVPEMRQIILDMGISVVLILVLTAAVMTIWIYKGIINPITKLKVATQNIRDGNLDFTIEAESDDEIGELCRNFEQMRQRLKSVSYTHLDVYKRQGYGRGKKKVLCCEPNEKDSLRLPFSWGD